MSTISKERATGIANGEKCYTHDDVVELARIALASLEAEPAAYWRHAYRADGFCYADGINSKKHHEANPISQLSDGDYWKVTPLYTAPPAPVVPDGLRLALSNAGIAAPESDEFLFATHEKYVQLLVTWVKDRKPFQPAPVAPYASREQFEQWMLNQWGRDRESHDFFMVPTISGQDYSDSYTRCMWKAWNACRTAMLQGKPNQD
ncbi:hypothetical protein [Enterobacter asburiae]|uniref:hypothetical protein n=1 Tax=Enterobacter asburiae TaxID=61645 RepID=UPI003BD5A854